MTRRLYRFNPETHAVEEVSPDFSSTEKRAPVPTEALTYAGLRHTDGTDLSSRTKHREFMKANGLSLAGDFTQTWAKADQQRADFFAGKHEHKGLKEAIGRAIDIVRTRRR